jgi:hypothetical protein
MGKIDPEQERERWAARYSAMSDLELQKVGGDPAALTEWAQGAFLEEIKKRGMEWKPEPRLAKPIAEEEILIRMGSYPDRNTAGLDRDLLADKGIETYLSEELPGDEQSASGDDAKETQLLVHAKDLIVARQQLAQRQEFERVAQEQLPEAAGSNRPVVLRRYRDMPAAFVEKSVLDNAGIECFLQDDNVVRMDWLWSNAMGGIKLMVRAKDAEEAEEILSQGPPRERVEGKP